MKAKNVVTLSVNKIFAQPGNDTTILYSFSDLCMIEWLLFNTIFPGIGVPGVSSTDTNNPLFLGGHPRFRQTHTGSTQLHHLFQSLVSLHSFNSKSTFSLNSFSRPGKFSIRGDQVNYSGCMKEVVIEGKPVEITADSLIGDIHVWGAEATYEEGLHKLENNIHIACYDSS